MHKRALLQAAVEEEEKLPTIPDPRVQRVSQARKEVELQQKVLLDERVRRDQAAEELRQITARRLRESEEGRRAVIQLAATARDERDAALKALAVLQAKYDRLKKAMSPPTQ
jgi:hypothetical protein